MNINLIAKLCFSWRLKSTRRIHYFHSAGRLRPHGFTVYPCFKEYKGNQKRGIKSESKKTPSFKKSSSWKKDAQIQDRVDQYAKQFEEILLEKLNQCQKDQVAIGDNTKKKNIGSLKARSTQKRSTKKKKRIYWVQGGSRIRISRRLLKLLRNQVLPMMNDARFFSSLDDSSIKPPRPDLASESIFYQKDSNSNSAHMQLDSIINEAAVTKVCYTRRSSFRLVLILFLIGAIYEVYLLLCEHFYADPEFGFMHLRTDFEKLMCPIPFLTDESASISLSNLIRFLGSVIISADRRAAKELIERLRVMTFIWQTRYLIAHSYDARLCHLFLDHLNRNAAMSPYFLKSCERLLFEMFQDDANAEMCIQNNAVSTLLQAMQNRKHIIGKEKQGDVYAKLIFILLSSEKRASQFLNRNLEDLDVDFENLVIFADEFPQTVSYILASIASSPDFKRALNSYRTQIVNTIVEFLLKDHDHSTIQRVQFVKARLYDEEYTKWPFLKSEIPRTSFTLKRINWHFLPLGIPYLFTRYYSFGMWNNFGALLPRRRFWHVLRLTGKGFLAMASILALQAKTDSIVDTCVDQIREHPSLAPISSWTDEERDLLTAADISFAINIASWTAQMGLAYICPFIIVPIIVAHL